MKRKWKVAAAVTLGVMLLCGWLVYQWAFPPFVPPQLPMPNGYDELLRAAEMLAPRTDHYDEMEPGELAAVVEQNEPALKRARNALAMPCMATVDWARDPAALGADNADLKRAQLMRKLARAFAADMRAKTARQQPSAAVSSGIEAVQLGHQSGRGGLIIDYLVGLAVRGMAINELRDLAVEQPMVQNELLRGLLPVAESGESADEVINREVEFIRAKLRGIHGIMMRLQLDDYMLPAVKSVRQAEQRELARSRILQLHLALHLYHEASGRWPQSLSELVPSQLPQVPGDPYVSGPFVYRIEGDGYRLYSVGSNRRDDGGVGDDSGTGEDMLFELEGESEIEAEGNR